MKWVFIGSVAAFVVVAVLFLRFFSKPDNYR